VIIGRSTWGFAVLVSATGVVISSLGLGRDGLNIDLVRVTSLFTDIGMEEDSRYRLPLAGTGTDQEPYEKSDEALECCKTTWRVLPRQMELRRFIVDQRHDATLKITCGVAWSP
jgi:hypothetical protein